MRHVILGFLFLFLVLPVGALNLTEIGYYHPTVLAHYQDVDYRGDTLAIFSGSGGVTLVDLRIPDLPQRLGILVRPNQEPLPNLDVRGTTAAVCAEEDGLLLVNLTNPVFPALYTNFTGNVLSYHDVKWLGPDTLACAIGTQGWGIVAVSNPAQPRWIAQYLPNEGANMRSIAFSASRTTAFLGSENKVAIYDRTGSGWSYQSSVALTGNVEDITVVDNTAYAACGSRGVMVIAQGAGNYAVIDSLPVTNSAMKLSATNSKLVISDWDRVLIYDISTSLRRLIASKNTVERAMCAGIAGDTIIVGDWSYARNYRYGTVGGADIDVSTREIHFPVIPIITPRSQNFTLYNTGGQTLNITSYAFSNPDYTLSLSRQTIPAHDSALATITYTPTAGRSGNGNLRFQSNDGDEPALVIRLFGNPPPNGVAVGNSAPDFTLPTMMNGETWNLLAHRGRVIVLCYFATW